MTNGTHKGTNRTSDTALSSPHVVFHHTNNHQL